MKALAIILGLVMGAVGALALLLNNPLQPSRPSISPTASVYDWRASEFHGASFGTAGLTRLPVGPRSQPFVAAGISTANAAVLILTDADGQPAALATRITVLGETSDLLRSDIGVSSYTNIIWPNYGTLFLQSNENRWSLVRDTALTFAGIPNSRAKEGFRISRLAGVRDVIGGSGAFAKIGRRYVEELRWDEENPERLAGTIGIGLLTDEN
ncbi:MAG: hypothetical protein CL799_12555 [Chromatiales bacterium]|nr:hypothetical protein [Chromatiales bacterium]MDP6151620.1 hypothetical protein [Gammaproteobacteria bacterium]MDP7270287.1 hypothetical protein [Gammaproteobacteria bacterium]HJP05223.1 hypothetical protein [Gammaproteobacteria bacterium]